jgi:hypothetical protein
MAEGGVGTLDDGAQRLVGDFAVDKTRNDVESDIGKRLVGESSNLGWGETRPGLGEIEATIAGKSGQYGV